MRTPTNPQTYALALHWAYLTCPDIDLPEPQRSEAIQADCGSHVVRRTQSTCTLPTR
jgi:hypothetical protein